MKDHNCTGANCAACRCSCQKCISRRWLAANMTPLHLMLTNEQMAKLTQLAKYRSTVKNPKTPEDCIRDFIDSCVPSGSGWKHPTEFGKGY